MLAPWFIWLSFGRIHGAEVAAVSFASGLVYLRALWRLGEHAAAERGRLGPYYCPPGPAMALAVCIGLAGAFTLPGLSTFALVDTFGLSWAEAETAPAPPA